MGYKNMKYGDQAEQPKMPTGTKTDNKDQPTPAGVKIGADEVKNQIHSDIQNQGGADYLGALKAEDNSPTKYDYLRDATAKDLLNSHVLTTISNEISRKNLNTEMAQMGLNNSNYSKTAEALMGNAYMQAINQNQANADKRLMEYDMQEAADKADRQDKSVESLAKSLASSTRQDSIETYLKGYGINVSQDLQGNYVLNGEGWDKLTNEQRQQILNALVASKEARINSDEEAQNLRAERILDFIASAPATSNVENYLASNGFYWNEETHKLENDNYTDDQLDTITDYYLNLLATKDNVDANAKSYTPSYIPIIKEENQEEQSQNGKSLGALQDTQMSERETWGDIFEQEFNTLKTAIRDNKIKDGDVIMIENPARGYELIVYKDGKFSQINQEEYDNHKGHKYVIRQDTIEIG